MTEQHTRGGSTTEEALDPPLDAAGTAPGMPRVEDEADLLISRGRTSIGGQLRNAGDDEDGPGAIAMQGMLAGIRARMFGKTEERLKIGEFRVLRKLGSGGMGVVYEAYDPRLQRHVAVKVVRQMSTAGEADLQREARAIAKLAHPNVVAVHEVGRHESEIFVAMEYVPGGDLEQWAKQDHHWREVLGVYRQAGLGLAAAHDAGLVHGDFKPQNALYGEDGRVRVVDFGLARGMTGQPEVELDSRVTQPDMAFQASESQTIRTLEGGTPRYMAPEQYAGSRASQASDQYALALAIYETLFGEHPYAAEGHDWHQPPSWSLRKLSAVTAQRAPLWLQRVLVRALNPDPDQRWPDLPALLHELGQDPQARTRRRLGWAAGTTAVLSLAGLFGYSEYQRSTACQGLDSELGGVWDQGARAKLTAGLEKTGEKFALSAATQAQRVLDRYAGQWLDARRSQCEVEHGRHFVATRRTRLQAECLDQRRDALSSVVSALSSGTAGTATAAVEASSQLPPISACASEAVLSDAIGPFGQREDAAKIRDLRKQITDAWARSLVGDFEGPRERAETNVAAAKALGYKPLIAEAHQVLGEILSSTGANHERALAELEAAVWAGTEVQHDRVVAIASAMMPLSLARLDDLKAAERWIAFSQAAIHRFGGGGREEAYLQTNIGAILGERGDIQRALPATERALVLKRQLWGDDHIDVAKTLNNLANLNEDLGHLKTARRHLARAAETMLRVAGDGYPPLGLTLANLGNIQAVLGEYNQAEHSLDKARALLSEALGPAHPWLAAPKIGRCRLRLNRAELDAARDVCSDAIVGIAALTGEGSKHVAELKVLRGRALVALGRNTDANADAAAAAKILGQTSDASRPRVAELNLLQAELAQHRGDREEAIRLAELAAGNYQKYTEGHGPQRQRAQELLGHPGTVARVGR